MSGAVQINEAAVESWQATGTEGAPNLKQVAADRLAAHRQRRAAAAAQEAELESRTRQHREAMHSTRRDTLRQGASTVRDAVVARYKERASYREFLAGAAELAISQAQAEAEVAARNARAVAETQMALLEELDTLNRPDPGPREGALAQKKTEVRAELSHALADIVLGARELIDERPMLTMMETFQPAIRSARGGEPESGPAVREISAAGLTVRLFEDMPAASSRMPEARPRRGAHAETAPFSEEEMAETLTALEEEIDFRRAPAFSLAPALEVQTIPGNLLEFPRELIAARRARPRLAEGPLRDKPGEPQLRIFEVEPEQESVAPFETVATAPEWQTLQLGGLEAEQASPSTASDAQTHLSLPLYAAPLERRLMSAVVDGCCLVTAWVVAATCVAEIAGPSLRAMPVSLLAVSGLAAFAVFGIFYQMLFFSLADATPGMRYARIALCTFGEGHPSRRAMRRRVLSTILAACPLGLGLAWVLMDNETLGWHDRMSRMYQRAY